MNTAGGVDPGSQPRPLVAERTKGLLQLIRAGVVCGAISAICFVAASLTLVRYYSTSRLWPVVANGSSAVLLLLALVQWRIWERALAEWAGVLDVNLVAWLWPSAAAFWLSLVLGVLVPFAGLQVMGESTPLAPAYWLALVGSLTAIAAAALAGMHRFDPQGPPGSVPAVIRRNLRR